jgi:putative oxidoreductase
MSEPTSTYPSSGSTGFGGPGFAVPEPRSGDTRPNETSRRRALTWNPATDLGLVLLRFAVGGVVFAHGVQHVFGLWGGIGIGGLTRAVEAFGFTNAPVLAWVVALTELLAGAGLVLGVLTPLAAAGVLGLMVNAVLLKSGNGFFVAGPPGAGAVELEVVLGLGAAALALTGAGRIALESGRTWNRRPAPWGVLFLVVGVAAALLVYFLLHTAQPGQLVYGG